MTTIQKVIKYLAIALAIFLSISIIGGILGAAGLFGFLFDSDVVQDELKTYTVSNSITNLKIEIAAADFTINKADSFSVESNLKHITVTEKNGTLIITEKKKIGIRYNEAKLILNIPSETVFKTANIITGAGRLTVDNLSADSLNLVLGAGEVKIDSLSANSNCEIDGGAGKITISDGKLHSLDLDMGVGEFNMTAALYGNNDLELGVGETGLTLIGNEDDYSVNVEKGVGNVSVNGKEVSYYNTSNGNTKVDIEGGVGAIKISFTNKEQ